MGRERGGFRGRRRGPRPPRGRRPYRPSGPREYTQTLPSDRDRMSMLTGESDPPFKSRYGGRDEYDPIDARFNRQFSEAPRGRQPWDSDPRGNPLERDPLEGYDTKGGRDVSRPTGRGRRTGFYNTYSGDKGPFATGKDGYSGDMGPFASAGPIWGASDMGRPVDTGRKYYSNQDLKEMRGDPVSDVERERRRMFNEPVRQEKYDDSAIKQRLREECSPKHVPYKVFKVDDIPYTLNGKKIELAIKKIINGEEVSNKSSIANPESLKLFENISI